MAEDKDEGTGDGLPIAPSMDVALASVAVPHDESTVTMRLVSISGLAILLGIGGGLIAKILLSLIAIISNFAFFGRFSTHLVPLTTEVIGAGVLAIPVLGAIIVGIMARRQ